MPEDDVSINFLMGPGGQSDILPNFDPETDLLDWDQEVGLFDENDQTPLLIGPTFPGGIWTREEYEARLAYEADAPRRERFLRDIERIKQCRKKLLALGKIGLVGLLDIWIHTEAEALSVIATRRGDN